MAAKKVTAKKLPKLGTGKRFANLTASLSRKGVANPAALAAAIGRKVHGAKKFAQLAAKGKQRQSAKRK